MKEKREKHIISYIFLGLIMVLFVSVCLRFATRTILVKKLHMDNAFTKAVFFDAKSLTATDELPEVAIDFASLYPFSEEDIVPLPEVNPVAAVRKFDPLSGLKQKVFSLEKKFDDFTTDFLMGYDAFTYMARKYESLIRWNFVSYAEYNGILALDDGYLATITGKTDVSDAAESVLYLKEYCENAGAEFLYVNAPVKVCKTEDESVALGVDFANANADALLEDISGINVLDLRDMLHSEGKPHHSYFYRTDHHWTTETGVMAAKEIVTSLKDAGIEADASMLSTDNLESRIYKDWFLGSQGRKVTLANTTPDDFSLLLPNYETNVTIEVPTLNLVKTGSFEVTYDMSQIEVKDFNQKSPYAGLSYGDRALVKIKNNLATNDTKVLFVHDSFGDAVTSWLTLGVSEVHAIDPRSFNGSIRAYINEFQPDVVIVLMAESSIYNPNLNAHNSLFDFR